MKRSFFVTVFLRLTLAMAFVAGTRALLPQKDWYITVLAVIGWAALAAVWTTYSVRQAISPLERAAGAIADRPDEVAEGTLSDGEGGDFEPGYRDFERLSKALAGAAAQVDQSLEQSKESRRELEALLDSMQDAVIAVDAAGRIQWSNQKMQRLMPGASSRGTLGSGSVRVGHALVQTIRDPEVLACVRSALDSRTVCERKSTTLLPGKTFEINASPMPGGGAVAVLHDVTRIEQVERTQRDFVANVSHELRTPLTSITGYVETLLDHEESLTPVAREFLSTILKNATRMNRLTEDLLVMARIESTEQKLQPSPIPADSLVREAIEAMSGLVQDSEAVLEIGEVTSRQVFADHDAVMQVLSNLIENGIKYGRTRSNEFSRVVVSANEISEPYEMVEFRVRDFGQGIAFEHLGRIFERFYRVDKARSRESGGTGLGLAIARHMVEAQGGTIRAESELHRGSTFIFSLPVAQYPVTN
ncbi:two-component system phosphate regulon sensor histidine kinase PhoR [Granulicella aggregans]|uniref:histidine kinase n=1 Tax=Granulicella aggregans TaxID=474949 RepID=A0A7W7Z8S2_9BACT|nr:ATP-binding protein [Granulicella aggregans]MBB5055380.1 two-component system phosphate regulon sensor histidine kinase PhoR [Granulicella aggregans]